MARRLLLAAIAFLLLGWSAPAEQPAVYTVIVNESNPVSSLTKDQLSRLFLKKTTVWDKGGAVLAVDLAEGSPLREIFTRDIHRRSVAAVKAFWQQRIFSGSDVPPPEFSTDAEVIAYVKAHTGAIGYVSELPSDPGVKPLKISG